MRVLAIDQGTSATKALVVEDDGSVSGLIEVPVRVNAAAGGAVEVDPEGLWNSVVTAGRAAVAAAGGGQVDAIGLANQGETVLAWDRASGAPRSAGIVWQDRRASDICTRLAADGWDARLAELTGLELDPYFSAPKVAWLRPQVDAADTITTTDTWLLHRLAGAFVTDVSTASRSLVLGLDDATWNDEACRAFGIDTSSLPTVVTNAEVIGTTSAFGGEVPVAGLCVDQQAALFAESCFAAGEAKCTYGTGAFLLASTGSTPTRSTHGLVGCVAWQLPLDADRRMDDHSRPGLDPSRPGLDPSRPGLDHSRLRFDSGPRAVNGSRPAVGDGRRATTWCLDGQVYTAGSAVRWLQELGVVAEPADLDRLGGSVASARSTIFVPGLAGLAAPFWKPRARGAFVGLDLATDRAEIVRAVIDGIAASVACLARAAAGDLGQPLQRLRVDGGLTRSATLLQAQADLAQLPVDVYPSPHATALGVAAFARLGMGASTAPADAVGAWKPVTTVDPQISSDEAADRLARWELAARSTMDFV